MKRGKASLLLALCCSLVGLTINGRAQAQELYSFDLQVLNRLSVGNLFDAASPVGNYLAASAVHRTDALVLLERKVRAAVSSADTEKKSSKPTMTVLEWHNEREAGEQGSAGRSDSELEIVSHQRLAKFQR